MFSFAPTAVALRRKLLYVPLALHLTLSGCAGLGPATPSGVGPFARVEQVLVLAAPGRAAGPSLTIRIAPSAFTLQEAVHRWTQNDVVKYVLRLKQLEDGNYVAMPGMVADLVQKGGPAIGGARFTGLRAGASYRVELETWGNAGGAPEATLQRLDGQHPQSQDVTFPDAVNAEQDQPISFTPHLDVTEFDGRIAVGINAPDGGGFTTTTTPSFNLITATTGTSTTSTTTSITPTTSITTSLQTFVTTTLIPTSTLSVSIYPTTILEKNYQVCSTVTDPAEKFGCLSGFPKLETTTISTTVTSTSTFSYDLTSTITLTSTVTVTGTTPG